MVLPTGHCVPTTAHYSKVVMEDDNSDGEEVSFMNTIPSPTPKTPTNNNSLQSQLHMNTLYYLFVLQAFTLTGLFNAFLFYQIP